MVTAALAISTLTFLFLLGVALYIIKENNDNNKKLLQENQNLNLEYQSLADVKMLIEKISHCQTGFFKIVFNPIEDTVIHLPFRVLQRDMTNSRVFIKFDFDVYKNIAKQNLTNVIFDDDSLQYLKMREMQWHPIISEDILWSEFNASWTITEEVMQKAVKSKTLKLNEFEKGDINSFLKFSNISEETKDSIRKVLNI
jgi:hypothetical protein